MTQQKKQRADFEPQKAFWAEELHRWTCPEDGVTKHIFGIVEMEGVCRFGMLLLERHQTKIVMKKNAWGAECQQVEHGDRTIWFGNYRCTYNEKDRSKLNMDGKTTLGAFMDLQGVSKELLNCISSSGNVDSPLSDKYGKTLIGIRDSVYEKSLNGGIHDGTGWKNMIPVFPPKNISDWMKNPDSIPSWVAENRPDIVADFEKRILLAKHGTEEKTISRRTGL